MAEVITLWLLWNWRIVLHRKKASMGSVRPMVECRGRSDFDKQSRHPTLVAEGSGSDPKLPFHFSVGAFSNHETVSAGKDWVC
jgi:hypothetical protein